MHFSHIPPQKGVPRWGIWDPLLEGYMGPNHIDARLGHQCNYGVLDPLFGTLPPDPGSGVWDPIPWDQGSQGIGVPWIAHTGYPWDWG